MVTNTTQTTTLRETYREPKKRIRYKIPTYKKFYTVYRYDRQKFRQILNEKLKGLNQYTQDEILNMCYLVEDDRRLMDSDEKSIFRYATLQKIHELLFLYCLQESSETGKQDDLVQSPAEEVDFCETKMIPVSGLFSYPDEKQAELPNTWDLPLKERLRIHLRLLRLLRNKVPIKEAVKQIRT